MIPEEKLKAFHLFSSKHPVKWDRYYNNLLETKYDFCNEVLYCDDCILFNEQCQNYSLTKEELNEISELYPEYFI